jgi:hypothetical protein
VDYRGIPVYNIAYGYKNLTAFCKSTKFISNKPQSEKLFRDIMFVITSLNNPDY